MAERIEKHQNSQECRNPPNASPASCNEDHQSETQQNADDQSAKPYSEGECGSWKESEPFSQSHDQIIVEREKARDALVKNVETYR